MVKLLTKNEEAANEMRKVYREYIISKGMKIVNSPDLK